MAAVGRATRSHRAPEKADKPLVRGSVAVGATAAFGAVVTGSLLAVTPGASQSVADVSQDSLTPLDLTNASQALAMQPATQPAMMHGADDAGSATALMPVTTPSDHYAAADQRDVEMLHKADQLAAQAAAAHALASKQAFIINGGGSLDDWIAVALDKMNMSESLAPGIRAVIMKESRGNPRAINRWDSNALAGRPSQGLMQTVPSTFRAYVLPELSHLPITNPVANITAGVRYMIANYGLSTLLKGGRFDGAGNYLGY
ncbi:MAG TPA: transglycosylase SLT domain-containing protein [Pseudonocardia sp.]|jgi:soluble lytic murein transglycosylase-like protein|nr:transglycosylase SLT domain-containing protein [Pseudonocardia sp.]